MRPLLGAVVGDSEVRKGEGPPIRRRSSWVTASICSSTRPSMYGRRSSSQPVVGLLPLLPRQLDETLHRTDARCSSSGLREKARPSSVMISVPSAILGPGKPEGDVRVEALVEAVRQTRPMPRSSEVHRQGRSCLLPTPGVARCRSVACSRLARSSGADGVARSNARPRLRPPGARDNRDCARAREVDVVGNGAPSESYGFCSVTAGSPYGQRMTTRRSARGGLPSWRSTSIASAVRVSRPRLPPGIDPLDDEEPFVRANEPEPTRFPHEGRATLVEREPAVEPHRVGSQRRTSSVRCLRASCART